jgi:hypothetical protein
VTSATAAVSPPGGPPDGYRAVLYDIRVAAPRVMELRVWSAGGDPPPPAGPGVVFRYVRRP